MNYSFILKCYQQIFDGVDIDNSLFSANNFLKFKKKLDYDLSMDLLLEAISNPPRNIAMLTFIKKLKKSYMTGLITDNFNTRINLLKKLLI